METGESIFGVVVTHLHQDRDVKLITDYMSRSQIDCVSAKRIRCYHRLAGGRQGVNIKQQATGKMLSNVPREWGK